MITFAGTPSIRAMVKCEAAARMAMPKMVFFISSAKIANKTSARPMVRRLRTGTNTPRSTTVSEKISGSGTFLGRGEMNSSAAF